MSEAVKIMALWETLNNAVLQEVDTSDVTGDMTMIFDKGHLRVENPFRLRCDFGEQVTPQALIGCCITASYVTETDLVVVFDGRISLSISLRPEDFSGPAAAIFTSPSGDVVACPPHPGH